MAMNLSQGRGHQETCEVNTTPLIDVMLVLLVMMIMTLPTQTHLLSLDLPGPTRNTPMPPTISLKAVHVLRGSWLQMPSIALGGESDQQKSPPKGRALLPRC